MAPESEADRAVGLGPAKAEARAEVFSALALTELELQAHSDEARKTKYQGAVVVEGIINLDGRVTNIKVVKGVGMGLDENAIAAVKTWRCKPAVGPSGQPVRTLVPIEVTFRLY